MSFITPLMLIGAFAAGIPIAIHLFFRSRYRTVPWAAMKFLLTSVEQTSRRLKFQEYLLLQTRILVLVMLALAMARLLNVTWPGFAWMIFAVIVTVVSLTWILSPFWQMTSSKPINILVYLGTQCVMLFIVVPLVWAAFYLPIFSSPPTARGAGKGDAVDAVLVFDTSFSMGASDGAKTRIERARDEALKIIDELPPHSTVQIVTCAGNRETLVGPRRSDNIDQARELIKDLELTHLATDLQVGIDKAQRVLAKSLAPNKELFVFSDMQKLGFDQQSGELRESLQKIKEKTLVHLVRCGTKTLKNAAVVGIVPQTGMPRPGDRVGFAVLVRNLGSESVENLTVSLMVDGSDKSRETTAIAKLPPGETRAVTLNCLLEKPGLRVLTAKIGPDDVEGDNRFDQVILVRDHVNILVVDGNYSEREPDRSSSYFLMHALQAVKDPDRASFYLQPRVVSARLATPTLLAKQDIVMLANVSLQSKPGARAEVLPSDFTEALEPFVRKGHSLVIFGGENVEPAAYNKVLGKKLGLLPMPLKQVVKMPVEQPLFFNRGTFNLPAFSAFKEDKLYEDFAKVIVWQALQMDENAATDIEDLRYSFYRQAWTSLPDFAKQKSEAEGKLPKGLFDLSQRTQNKDFGFVFEGTLVVPESGKYTFYLDAADGARLTVSGEEVVKYDGEHEMGTEQKAVVELTKGKQPIRLEYFQHLSRPGLAVGWSGPSFGRRSLSASSEESPINVILRLSNGMPVIANRKVDAGEVIFVATAPDTDISYAKSLDKTWTIWSRTPTFIPFMHVTVNHLLHGQTQTYNLVAGQTLTWYPTEKLDSTYNLVHPLVGKSSERRVERLKPPEKIGKRVVVTANDLPHAGIGYMTAHMRGTESIDAVPDAVELAKTGTPIAVIPDLRESENLSAYTIAEINEKLGFEPIHITAGAGEIAVSTGTERLNREWTVWVLMAVLLLVIGEVGLAWWCGKAW